MIAPTFLLAVLLVAGQASGEQQQGESSNVQPAVPVVNQPHIVEHGVVVENAPPSVGHQQQVVAGVPVEHQAHQVVHHVVPQKLQHAQHYAPSGLIQVVGGVEPQHQGPAPLRHYSAASGEQYGQPESASIPPEYKPWGSWGLYIGGNPADGYYSSYYKALSQSVADKQQVGAEASPVKPQVGAQAVLTRASGLSVNSPVQYDSYYTPADLNSGSRVSVVQQPSQVAAYPAQFGASGGPLVYNSYGVSGYGVEQPAQASGAGGLSSYAADSAVYGSTKRFGATKQAEQGVVKQEQVPAKGYYSYAAGLPLVHQSPVVVHQQQQQQHQVVAYPVPVGSQIVGAQPGLDAGVHVPYGVHGFTRYAIKPTVVAAGVVEPQAQYHHGVHSSPISQFPVYRQAYGHQQPLSFYGYPLSQLHYSQGSLPQGPIVDSVAPPASAASSSSSSYQSVNGVQHSPVASGASVQYEPSASSNQNEIKPKESSQ